MLKSREHIRSGLPGRRTTPRCHSKIRYKCLRDAIGAADAYMERIVITRSPMTPYYCKIHSCWHIGHSSKLSDIPARYPEKCVSRELLRREIACLSEIMGLVDVLDISPESQGRLSPEHAGKRKTRSGKHVSQSQCKSQPAIQKRPV